MAAGSYGEADAASANGHGVDGNGAGSDGGTGSARPRLTFEQLVQGLGWLLRGTSAKRSEVS